MNFGQQNSDRISINETLKINKRRKNELFVIHEHFVSLSLENVQQSFDFLDLVGGLMHGTHLVVQFFALGHKRVHALGEN